MNLIPSPDPAGLPGPPWLFVCLLLLTQTVHVIFMNYVWGGSWFLLWLSLDRKTPWKDALYHRCLNVMPTAISTAITFGVAPLLFVQVLYGQFFYTANVLMGWLWLTVLGLVLAAFYSVYLLKTGDKSQRTNVLSNLSVRSAIHLFVAVAFTATALLITANAVLAIHPEVWSKAYTGSTLPTVWKGIEIFLPRFLHNAFGALGIAGLWVVWIATYPGGRESTEKGARSGAVMAVCATAVQMGLGFWYLFSLPSEILKRMMSLSNLASVHLLIGVLLAIPLLVVKSLLVIIPTHRILRWIASVLAVLTVMSMVTVSEGLRQLFLENRFSLSDWNVQTQAAPVVLFLLLFISAVVVLAWIAKVVHAGFEERDTKE